MKRYQGLLPQGVITRNSFPSSRMWGATLLSGIVLTGVVAARRVPFFTESDTSTEPAVSSVTELEVMMPSLNQVEAALWRAVLVHRHWLPKTADGASPATSNAAAAQAEDGDGAEDQPLVTGRTRSAQPAPPLQPATPPPVASGATIDSMLEMRVAVARDTPALTIGASTAAQLVDTSGKFQEIPAQNSYEVRSQGDGIQFGPWSMASVIQIETTGNGYVFVDGSWFRGRLLLINDGGNLVAVNYVLLKEYLYSVVGTEMYPDWPIEALKAQAVAARSYALTYHVRPASRYYDLDNTQRFQAYLGIAKETNTSQYAVEQTAGEFISYEGGIVESLYAASDQIVADVHRGMGMSQTGAMELAKQGYTHNQILSRYYPGTTLARLEVQ